MTTTSCVILFTIGGINIYLVSLISGLLLISMSSILKVLGGNATDALAINLDLEANETETIIHQLTTVSVVNLGVENFEFDDIIDPYRPAVYRNKEQRTPYPKIFSLKILKIAAVVFGISGFVLEFFHFSSHRAFWIAVFITCIFCYAYYFSLKKLANQTIYNAFDPIFIHREATVITPVPIDGFGEIVLFIVGERHSLRAKSYQNVAIEVGKKVKIIKKNKSTCSVIAIY